MPDGITILRKKRKKVSHTNCQENHQWCTRGKINGKIDKQRGNCYNLFATSLLLFSLLLIRNIDSSLHYYTNVDENNMNG